MGEEPLYEDFGGNSTRKYAHVIKIGGSTLDRVFGPRKELDIFSKLAEKAIEAHREGYPIILTCGGGPTQDITKDGRKFLDPKQYSEAAKLAIEHNCKILQSTLSGLASRYSNPPTIQYCPTTADLMENGAILTRQISVVPFSSQELQLQLLNRIYPFNQSDAHTLIIAEGVGKYLLKHELAGGIKVHFIKDVDGIWLFDPNSPPPPGKEQVQNKRIRCLTIEDFLGNIDNTSWEERTQERTPDHLLEHSAGELFRDLLRFAKEIRIYSHTPAENLLQSVQGQKVGSILVNKFHQKHPPYRKIKTETDDMIKS